MRSHPSRFVQALALLAASVAQAVSAADTDLDALALESAPPAAAQVAQPTKAFVELGAGIAQKRGGGSRSIGRLSLDLRHIGNVAPSVRYTLSARLDATSPADPRVDNPVFSLREAFVGWQDRDAANLLDFGRINLRNGPAYGYNPTDFLRDNALRTITTADPFLLRENRLGTVMLRGQHLWSGGSLSLALAPRLATRRSGDGPSFDWGATNARERALATVNSVWSEAFSSQLLLYKEQGSSPRWGASATGLVSDSITAHGEWTRSREPDLLARALALPGSGPARNRAALGLSYTTATKLSLTTEYQYNGFALNRDAVRSLSTSDPAATGAYFGTALSLQDNAARQALLLYATQRDLVVKNLELTALAKFNHSDSSRLVWAELRYRMERAEVALQFQRSLGSDISEFGVIPIRGSVGLIATAYF